MQSKSSGNEQKTFVHKKFCGNLINFGSIKQLLDQRTLFAHLCTRCVCLTRDSARKNNHNAPNSPPS